jgi:hypothetical protein
MQVPYYRNRAIKKIILILLLIQFNLLHAQHTLLDSLIKQYSYGIYFTNEKLSGPGIDFILAKTRNAQFVNLGEEHNTKDIPVFTTGLFRLLQKTYGFEYLALEQDPLRAKILSDKQTPISGNKDSAFALIKRFPYSYTFASDQEITMMAEVNKLSTAKYSAVWGCDQAYGVMHYLHELIKAAPDESAKRYTRNLMDSVWIIESNRDNRGHYMIDKSKIVYFDRLTDLYKPKPGSHTEWLINTLKISCKIYKINRDGLYLPYPTGKVYYNNIIREDYMKTRFLEEYRLALQKEKKLPKAIFKFGQWHLTNSFGPGGALTLGNFNRNLARLNGMECFTIDMEIYGPPGSFYNKYVMNHDILKLFAARSDIRQWTIIDLVPFRYYLSRLIANKLIPAEVQQTFNRYILNFDALILFGNGEPATYNWKIR